MHAAAAPSARVGVALAGNPNTGKTSLFNRLTGGHARVGNYPGVTVEREVGRWRLGRGDVEVIDVPGAYSLAARSREEQVAVRALFGADGQQAPAVVVVVVDATQLVRNLYLVTQLLEAGLPIVVALNLIDVARAQGIEPDPARVQQALGVPVVAVSARTGEGLEALGREVEAVLDRPELGRAAPRWTYPEALERDLERLRTKLQARSEAESRAMALWALLSVEEGDELVGVSPQVRAEVTAIRRDAAATGRDVDSEIVGTRYGWLDVQDLRVPVAKTRPWTDRVDGVVLHPLLGGLLFLVVMGVMFQALFSWSEPAISAIETLFAAFGRLVRDLLPAGVFTDLVVDGVIGGVGSVLVFLPQILLLFFFIGFLEDSGYLARVAFLVDRLMKALGLHGRAFVPMLSGFACAVPAIMATRTLERRRDRVLTMLVVPLMTCSARLPVYTLVIAALIPAEGLLLGLLPMQGAAMVFMYVFSTGMALLAAGVLGRTVLRGPRVPLILELPPYRMPRLRTVGSQMLMRAKIFVSEAGRVILACTVVLWALLYFPRDLALAKDYDALKAGATEEAVAALEAEEASERLRKSYGGRIGRAMEPLIEPLGFDWKIGVGLVGAFAAREVFISTMGVVYGIGGEEDETSVPLREKLRDERSPDGARRHTPLVGLSLMIFFALSAQCMSTLAAVKRESRGWRWPIFLFFYMTGLAWVSSLVVYQGGRLLGLG